MAALYFKQLLLIEIFFQSFPFQKIERSNISLTALHLLTFKTYALNPLQFFSVVTVSLEHELYR